MTDNDTPFAPKDDEVIFADESICSNMSTEQKPVWKILIADDEREVHQITKLVLKDYTFNGREVHFISAYSGAETKTLLAQHPDTALLLLDVVMESERAGLDAVRYIRLNLKNKFVRIILRTGQPGVAPEKKVIVEYDINEYKEKTDLTTQKLFVTVTAALRAYQDLMAIEKTKRVLELVIQSTERLFNYPSMQSFTSGILKQILSILNLDGNLMYLKNSAFAVNKDKGGLHILAAAGDFENCINYYVKDVLPESIQDRLNTVLEKRESMFLDDAFVAYFGNEQEEQNLLYISGCHGMTDLEKDLMQIFSSNVSVAFENIYYTREVADTQKEIIFTLGELVDRRDGTMGHHVQRVAEFSYILALKSGLDRQQAELLKLASPMHDVGKIGIPDSILKKPGRLSEKEIAIIQTHSGIGYDILRKSEREIMKAATIIAQQHHERWDGKGYPCGLKGKEIHIFGRIMCLADVFDALSHKRIYNDAWPMGRVIEYIKEQREKQFDPELVDLFLAYRKEFISINDLFPECEK